MSLRYEITTSGDFAFLATAEKQLRFAASRAINDVLVRAQDKIVDDLEDENEFILRGKWWKPGTRYGINVRYSKPSNLEGSVGTAADWLLEAHGYFGGVKHPDKGGSNLANPDIENTRFGIRNKVLRSQKARKLVGSFKKRGKYGNDLIFQRVATDKQGEVRRNPKTGRPLRSSSKKKNTRIVLKYVLRNTAKVPYHPVVTRNGVIQFRLHFNSLFAQDLRKAIRTARFK